MTARFPIDSQGKWYQNNKSDRFSSIYYTRNINLNENGYIKMSPRTISIMDEATNGDFGVPLAIGRSSQGEYLVATSSNANFNATISTTANTWSENSGTTEPTLTPESHACWYQGLWHATTTTAVISRPYSGGSNQTWTSRITGLTSGVRHYLSVFASRITLCISNGNTVKQYTSAYAADTTLTLPSDYEVIGMAYNNQNMGIITRLGTTSASQNQESRFFLWDGTTTGFQRDAAIGADAAIAICAYKSSFAVLTRRGQLLYWNGGGFDELANFPFYNKDKQWGSILENVTLGESMIADGDSIYMNVGLELNPFGVKSERFIPSCPSGVWCFNPSVGLYHKWSPSISKVYVNSVTDANVDISTNIFTTSGTLPSTGNPVRLTASSNGLGGLTVGKNYFIIKLSSTTFKLASTKDNAELGTAIDITSKGADGLNYFWMYDIFDYGNTYFSTGSTGAGAIALTGETNRIYQDVIFGGDFRDTSLSANDSICMGVPYLDGRSVLVLSKTVSGNIKDSIKNIVTKFKPIKSTDSIRIKYKDKDVLGLPVTSSGNEATWVTSTSFTTAQDLSEAKTFFDAEGELEIEFISGAGGGQSVKIENITVSGTSYTVTTAEAVIGARVGYKSEYIIDNWKHLDTITSDDNEAGYKITSLKGSSKWFHVKLEMIGSDITLEDVDIATGTNEKL